MDAFLLLSISTNFVYLHATAIQRSLNLGEYLGRISQFNRKEHEYRRIT